MQRNIVRFCTDPPREMELIHQGTFWPSEIIVDGEGWLMGEVVGAGPDYAIREYVLADRLTPGQRFIRAVAGGA